LGAGPGLSVGMGTPDARVVASASYGGPGAPAVPPPPQPSPPPPSERTLLVPVEPPARPRGPASAAAPSAGPEPPARVRVTQQELVIVEIIAFDAGSDRLAPAAGALLARVARAMAEHPEIQRVAVEGFTDTHESPRARPD